jgi:CheY-like chemotaxis protein
VEDDEADAYLIEQALVDNPRVKEVVIAENGAEALEMVEHGAVRPDLAFVDLHMPRKDGFSLLTHFALRKVDWFPSVVLTSSRLRADELRSRTRGAIGFVTKPISQAKLREALNREIARV